MIETFNKAKDYLLLTLIGVIGAYIVASLNTIKTDLVLLKESLPPLVVRIENLETAYKQNQSQDQEQNERIAVLEAFVIPEKVKAKKEAPYKQD